ncbi:MAG TPA: hypothetical protein VFC84_19510 [Desulfosporosinus sp.]|nr:hypothetical protein [Desulfosporosinus sp.]
MSHGRECATCQWSGTTSKVPAFVGSLPGLRRGQFRTRLERGGSPALHHASLGPTKLQERLSAAYLPMVWTDAGLARASRSLLRRSLKPDEVTGMLGRSIPVVARTAKTTS